MFDPNMPLRHIPPRRPRDGGQYRPDGRIVIQGFIPVELLVETERRLFLTAVGELQNLREGPSRSS